MIDTGRIIKNTGFLYVRMLLVMVATLYTSRVVLDVLGVSDYGLYGLAGGIVGMLSFLNASLATATSRFLTYDIGQGNPTKLKQTFSTSFFSHLIIGIIVIILMETIGLWYIYNKAIIPLDRLEATIKVFHISVFTVLITFTQVPYNSLIIAHERMKAFAYISMIEVIIKLSVAFLIYYSPIDKLVFYAILMCICQCFIAMIYRLYCMKHWEESHLTKVLNFSTVKEMFSFSGWNLIAQCSEMLRDQGLIMLFGAFFQPFVVAAQSIATQLSSGVTAFTNNFKQAINPQIIKLYAVQNYNESKKLTLDAAIYVFELFLLIGIPILLLAEPILNLWLVDVPKYALEFSRCVIISAMLGTFSGVFYTPLTAANRVKSNSLAALFVCGGQFLIAYVLLKTGCDILWVQFGYIVVSILFSFIIKPILLIRNLNYSVNDFTKCFGRAFLILILSFPLPYITYILVDENSFGGFISILLISVLNVSIVIWVFLDKDMKLRIIEKVKRIRKRK